MGINNLVKKETEKIHKVTEEGNLPVRIIEEDSLPVLEVIRYLKKKRLEVGLDYDEKEGIVYLNATGLPLDVCWTFTKLCKQSSGISRNGSEYFVTDATNYDNGLIENRLYLQIGSVIIDLKFIPKSHQN